MRIILIYLVFLTFYINQVIGAVGFSIKGFSLFNLNIYLLLFLWVAVALKRKKIFLSNNVNKYIILLGVIVLASIFVKILRGEIPNISIRAEITGLKQWINPVLLFFILFNIIENEETCNRTLWGLCFLVIATILSVL